MIAPCPREKENDMITISKLIETLQEVEDKNLPVYIETVDRTQGATGQMADEAFESNDCFVIQALN
jgi:hypothetical protein